MPTAVIPELPDLPHGLGRHVNHDERSRAFKIRRDVPINPVEWARRVPVFDQGQLGSCTGNAAAGWLATDNAVRQGLTEVGSGSDPIAIIDEAVAIDIYAKATAIDPFDGAYPPDDTGSDGLSVTKVLQSMGLVDVYGHAFSLPDALAALQSGPVLFGTNWYDGMFTPHNGEVRVSGRVAGGHEYLCVGYDPARSVLRFVNSWGPDWGDDGYFVMTEATVNRLLSEDGDATAPHAVIVAPPDPDVDERPSWWGDFLTWANGRYPSS